jgi:hypothetical protein
VAFETWGQFNVETVSPLVIDYGRSTVGSAGTAIQYRYSRHAQKAYIIKGLSESAVKACLNAKKRQYNRKFVAWRKGTNWAYSRADMSLDYFAQVAVFNVVRREVVYDLQITVDETALMYLNNLEWDPLSEEGRANIESRFQMMGQPTDSYVSTWRYDEPGEEDS